MSGINYPNESNAYRKARNELLEQELELRAQIEKVASARRNLPLGGLLKENYEFKTLVNGKTESIKFDELFQNGKQALFLYSFMYAPNMAAACPMCTSILDGLEGQIEHIKQQVNIAVVAKHTPEILADFAQQRGWHNMPLISSSDNNYNADYHGEIDGRQTTIANVFVKTAEGIHHFWGAEMSYAPMIEGGNMRHVDLIWPLWNVLDMTPQGRGKDWYPKLSY